MVIVGDGAGNLIMILLRKSLGCHYAYENSFFSKLMRYKNMGRKTLNEEEEYHLLASTPYKLQFLLWISKNRVESSRVVLLFSFLVHSFFYHLAQSRIHYLCTNCAHPRATCTCTQSNAEESSTKWNSMGHGLGHCRPLIMLSIYWNFNLNLRKIAKWFRSSLPFTHLKSMPAFLPSFPLFYLIYLSVNICSCIHFCLYIDNVHIKIYIYVCSIREM